MAETSKIEWTDATWNPITGCNLVDDGCRINEQWLDQPLRWRKARMIFVCVHGDLFHEQVPDEWIDQVFAVMALAPHHTFQVLTKRPDRMRQYLSAQRSINGVGERIRDTALIKSDWKGPLSVGAAFTAFNGLEMQNPWWPLRNVWLGTSVSDQESANERIGPLMEAPAAIRFLSVEPMLGKIDLAELRPAFGNGTYQDRDPVPLKGYAIRASSRGYEDSINADRIRMPKLDWVICGGESGSNARPMHPDWARDLRDDCHDAGVKFFFKQWGNKLDCREHNALPESARLHAR